MVIANERKRRELMVDKPEKKSPTEPVDVQRKIEDIMTGK